MVEVIKTWEMASDSLKAWDAYDESLKKTSFSLKTLDAIDDTKISAVCVLSGWNDTKLDLWANLFD